MMTTSRSPLNWFRRAADDSFAIGTLLGARIVRDALLAGWKRLALSLTLLLLLICVRACSFSRWFFLHTHPLGVEEGPKQKMRRYLARQQSSYAAAMMAPGTSQAPRHMTAEALRAGFVHPQKLGAAASSSPSSTSLAASAALHSTLSQHHKRLLGFARHIQLRTMQPLLARWMSRAREAGMVYLQGDLHCLRRNIQRWRLWAVRQRRRAIAAQVAATLTLRPAPSPPSQQQQQPPRPHYLRFTDPLAQNAARQALRVWSRRISDRHRVAHWVAHLQARRRESSSRGVMGAWRDLAAQKRGLRILGARHTQSLLRACWQGWVGRIRRIHYMTQLAVQTAAFNPAHMAQQSYFNHWRRRCIVLQFQRDHQIQRCLHAWRDASHRGSQHREDMDRAAEHHRSRIMPQQVKIWRRAARRRKRQRVQIQEDEHRADNFRRAHAIETWLHALQTRKKEQHALQHQRARTLAVHFIALKKYAQTTRTRVWCLSNSNRMCLTCVCFSLLVSVCFSYTRSWRLHCARVIAAFQSAVRVQPALVWWQLRVLQRSDRLRRHDHIARVLAKKQLKNLWTQWRDAQIQNAQRRGSVLRSRSHIRTQSRNHEDQSLQLSLSIEISPVDRCVCLILMRSAIHRWRGRVALRERLSLLAARSEFRVVASAFAGWVGVAGAVRSLESRAEGFHQGVVLAGLRARIFDAWTQALVDKTHRTRELWQRWRHAFQRRLTTQDFCASILTFDAHRALRLWARTVSRQRAMERAEDTLRARAHTRVKHQVLSEWLRVASRSRARCLFSSTVCAVRDRLAQRHVLGWMRFVSRREGALETQEAALIVHRRNRAIQCALRTWHARSEDAKRVQLRRHDLAIRARGFLLDKFLNLWKRSYHQRQNEGHRVKLVVGGRAARTLRALWLRWHEAMYSRSFQRYELQVARTTRATHAIRKWRKILAYRVALRTALQVADTSAKTMLLKASLRGWKVALKLRRYKLACIAWISQCFERNVQRHVLLTVWRSHTLNRTQVDRKQRQLEHIERVRKHTQANTPEAKNASSQRED